METLRPTNEEVLIQSKKSEEDAVNFLLGFYSAESKPYIDNLKKSIKRLKSKHSKLNKTRPLEIKNGTAGQEGTYDNWLKQLFSMPDSATPRASRPTSSDPSSPTSTPSKSPALTRKQACDIREELEQAHQFNALTTKQACDTRQELEQVHELYAGIQSKVESLEMKLNTKSSELKRVRSRETFHRKKAARLEDQESEPECEESDVMFEKLKEENLQLKEEIKNLQEILRESKMKSNIIETYDKTHKCYNAAFREMVYKLLQEHVTLNHVGPVIEAVLDFVDMKVDKLPSEKTIRNMNGERLHLAQVQLGEELSEEKNTTLYSDETSKAGEKYMGFHASDAKKRFWVLGVRDLATKSAEDTLKTFKQVLQDIDDKVSDQGTSESGKKILCNIQNTMSDRAATELKWHEMLENYRKNILPEVKEHWDELNESERQTLEKLRNFYCGLHSYVQVAETAGAALLELQKDDQPGPQMIKTNEPATVRLIRTAAKAFARGGDEKSGAFAEFCLYDPVQKKLKDSGMSVLPIVPFRGNRFNIVFFNGGFVFFLHKEMMSFIQGKDKPNQLLRAVLADLNNPLTLAGCKAFGLINKIVMGPLWRVLENNDVHILDMGKFIQEILDNLETACANIESFMSGTIVCSSKTEWVVKKDSVYDCLVSQNLDVDNDVQTVLGVVLPAITAVLKDHYSDLLSGNFSSKDREETESVIKHNKFAERVFAYTDQLLRFKPNIHHFSMEAYVMFCLNKTAEWLSKKDPEEKKCLIAKSRSEARELQSLYRKRRKEIREERAENLRKKRAEEETRKQNRMKERETVFKDILFFGLYQNEDQLEDGLKNIKGVGEKSEALKAQLRFREKILMQSPDDQNLFRFTELDKATGKRKTLKWQELKEKCRVLIKQACEVPISSSETDKAKVHKAKDSAQNGRKGR